MHSNDASQKFLSLIQVNMTKSSSSVTYIIYFILALYAVLLLDYVTIIDFKLWGLEPRTLVGLRGVAFAPMLHANAAHLVSNTVPLIVLMGVVFIFYPKVAFRALLYIWLLGGLLLWLFGRDLIHIGASGLIYGLASFLVTKGFVKGSIQALFIAILVAVAYGGLVWGLLPMQSYISWEGHLFGAFAGVVAGVKLKS